ncbi:hypothetical protein N7456_003267 [Penicillium angulare]|uniref:A to I editase domain-containing protein n=1 Tax=Penicillium angulare TaxID=116970 RepID=A0A9W9KIK5_9EURO|nr:hypothetical protein N7456_003267 [Penicillium angulare]
MSESSSTTQLASRIAVLVHEHFDALPARSKPTIFPDGSREWIPMTGIVAVKGENTASESLHCIAITQTPRSGAKCLSASHMPRCRGLVLHDCHAEILAIRAFNYWLLTECHGLMSQEIAEIKGTPPQSPFIRRRDVKQGEKSSLASLDWPPFELQPDVKLYMYCTCAPCGDGSMELCMASQEDATPWEVKRDTKQDPEIQEGAAAAEHDLLDGRAHFSLLGIVRRKPARTDAESTRSKSCSDKLALKQVSSLLSWQAAKLVIPTENAYLAGLILPEDEISNIACERAFGENGRMKDLKGRSWGGETTESSYGYRFRPFEILAVSAKETETRWKFSKPKSTPLPENAESTENVTTPKKSKPGSASAVWTFAPTHSHTCDVLLNTGSKQLPSLRRSKTGLHETIIAGVKQGHKISTAVARGASALSRARLWALLQSLQALESKIHDSRKLSTQQADAAKDDEAHKEAHPHHHNAMTYKDQKEAHSESFNPLRVREEAIRDARDVLKGWSRNVGDENWGLDVLIDPKKRKR